jgi:ribosomal protein S20
MKKITKNLGVALVSGLLALGSVSVSYAAEDAGGVVKYIGMSYDAAKAALEAAKLGDKQKTTESLKQVRQYSKEITGDAAGMKLQKVNQAVKAAGNAVDAGDTAKAAELLEPAVKSLEEMKNAK